MIMFALFFIIIVCFTDSPLMSQLDKNCTSFYLIRHAEKVRDNTMLTNPRLNPDLLTRAKKWIDVFKNIKIYKIFSTNFHRTIEAVLTFAQSVCFEVDYYNPSKAFYENLFKYNIKESIHIVGHNNKIPQLVNTLIGEDYYCEICDNKNSTL